jgi:glycosyltransferase involved in cell wall biosynthesis
VKVIFILPGKGGGGGAHSVVQESIGLKRLGADVAIASTLATLPELAANYPELSENGIEVHAFAERAELGPILPNYDLSCATTWESVHVLVEGMRASGRPLRTAYYVQDYEPLFCIPGSREWENARQSYTLIPDAQLFAKTRFLCDIVGKNHHKNVAKVSASIDHDVYYPSGPRNEGRISIAAMVRPKTPRRAPRRTARILELIASRYGESVSLISFGCDQEDLDEAGIRFSEHIEHRGTLARRGVADVLRQADLFLDLSDYQAFGRTALEGMACGCVPVLPVFGGADEFVRHWINGFVVDTRSDAAIIETVEAYVSAGVGTHRRLRMAALETALDYTIEKAAFSELKLFESLVN